MTLRNWYLVILCMLNFFVAAQAEVSLGKSVGTLPAVKTSEGKSVDWSSYESKVMIFEWLNPDCPFVKRHYEEKTFQQLVGSLDESKVQWIGVNSTHYMSPEATEQWRQEQGVSWPIIVDQDGKFGRFFGAKTTPHIFVVAQDGSLLYQGAIDDDPYGKLQPLNRKSNLAFLLSFAEQKETFKPFETQPYGCSVKYAD
ncbi:MAG: redoxin domain-containing protein [Bdellovibrionales bacterium]|nr:redoxin domain-containing protein [Bdellovibrionales bacterium]